jgi:hypothetical protein
MAGAESKSARAPVVCSCRRSTWCQRESHSGAGFRVEIGVRKAFRGHFGHAHPVLVENILPFGGRGVKGWAWRRGAGAHRRRQSSRRSLNPAHFASGCYSSPGVRRAVGGCASLQNVKLHAVQGLRGGN